MAYLLLLSGRENLGGCPCGGGVENDDLWLLGEALEAGWSCCYLCYYCVIGVGEERLGCCSAVEVKEEDQVVVVIGERELELSEERSG